ncbi:MAG TPA: 30S ribosomal protein S12 methylthiotransferase RimO [Desulfopila sp.]|nr:30S ribosomal protein S12 methylthiotransferase RimO [Desulfopila sp.]
MKNIHVTSLGCPKNFVDSEVMIGVLERRGWTVVEHPEEAAVLLVNTCGFIQPAVEESIEEILGLSVYTQNGERKLVVTGCMVQRYRDRLSREIPEIDLLLGTEAVADIAGLLEGLLADKRPQGRIYMPETFLMDASLPRTLATPSFRAWMKITEGCDNHCSYCMIPSIRGRLRSRQIDDLTREALQLEAKGVRELTLIAQDLTAFGADRGKKDLVPLLESIAGNTAIPWVRLLYLYPSGINEDLLQFMAAEPRVVPYLDIPMQHVSDTILKRMNRPYNRQALFSLIDTIRTILPEVALRTTFLLGFPGETEADVNLVEQFLLRMHIDHVGVFAYANEEGCPSEFFKEQIPESEKQTRVERILSVQTGISAKIQKRYQGKTLDVLVEGLSRETDLLLEGRTRFQAPDIDGCVYINDGEARPGDMVRVRISETQIYDLVGAIV